MFMCTFCVELIHENQFFFRFLIFELEEWM